MSNKQSIPVLSGTNFKLPDQLNFYKGKVRDVYTLGKNNLVMIATDRISAFDCILPKCVPFKGQVLNQMAVQFLDDTRHIVPNWLISSPDPHVSFGKMCEPIKIEMVIRGYLAGHAWRTYQSGERTLCGVTLPEGLKENDKLPFPIITPSTKADQRHDEDISAAEILNQNIVSSATWEQLCNYTQALYEFGAEHAAKRGLILVDTKYEFGFINGVIHLMDEIHTPDSSRYFYAQGFAERQQNNEKQEQLSKEFVRQWLIENNFQGLKGQSIPEMPDEFVTLISNRYILLYETITGKKFIQRDYTNILNQIEQKIITNLNQ